MKIFSYRHSAQAGIIAIIVTTVLFALGLSVSNQVTREVVENIEREESTQALNAAEGGLETGNTSTTQVDCSTSDESSILLSEGDSVEMDLGSGNLDIMWELENSWQSENEKPEANRKHPALLLSHYKNGTVNYYPLRCIGCSSINKYNGYIQHKSLSSGDSIYHNKIAIGSGGDKDLNISGGSIRIKALFNNTYLKIPGLVQVCRSVAQENEQVRVVELRRTTPAAPSIMDYALFAGSGNIEILQ